MCMSRPLRRLWRNLRGLPLARAGVASVEFALLAPTIITIFIATYEAANLIRARMKFDTTAAALANFVSQQDPTASGGTMTADFCTGVAYMLAPYSTSGMTAQVASVTNYSGTVKSDWTTTCGSFSGGSTATSLASSMVPNSGDSIIVAQTAYTFHPSFSYLLGSSFAFTNDGYARPRNNLTMSYAP
jgi:Flp pilus assembly protein TadG